MVIPKSVADALHAHAASKAPEEACGLLASENGQIVQFYPIENADASSVHYRMDPKGQLQAMLDMEDRNWELTAIYHSHTHTQAYPSPTDIGLAAYPDAIYLILSLARRESPELRGFSIHDGDVKEVDIEVESRANSEVTR